MNAATALSQPEICVEDWSSPEIPLSDLHDPTSSTTNSPGLGSKPTLPHEPLHAASPSPIADIPNIGKILNEGKGNKCNRIESSKSDTGANASQGLEGIPLFTKDMKLTFEPIRTCPPSALSAVSEPFYDPPSSVAPATMVPVPSFTNPSRESSGFSKDHNTRFSLLPYPDLFDFAIYDTRASQESSAGFRLSLLPADMTVAPDSPIISRPAAAASRDQYRSSAYSRLAGLCAPTKTNIANVKPVAALSGHILMRPRRQRGELPLASIPFNTSQRAPQTSTPTAIKFQDSLFMYSDSSPGSSGDWNVASLDDINMRLRDACNDLSRCMWTEEEFLRIVSP
jgi:hypothetical protein